MERGTRMAGKYRERLRMFGSGDKDEGCKMRDMDYHETACYYERWLAGCIPRVADLRVKRSNATKKALLYRVDTFATRSSTCVHFFQICYPSFVISKDNKPVSKLSALISIECIGSTSSYIYVLETKWIACRKASNQAEISKSWQALSRPKCNSPKICASSTGLSFTHQPTYQGTVQLYVHFATQST